MMSKYKSKTSSQKITDLFDQDWKNSRSNIRHKIVDSRSYDPITSWDAKSSNTSQFSKFNVTYIPTQASKPVCLSGAQVIPLDTITGMEVLNASNSISNASSALNIPLTKDQQDVGMTFDLNNVSAKFGLASSMGKDVVLIEKVGFKNQSVVDPKLELVHPPIAITEAGPNFDQKVSVIHLQFH
jgi:hypothetical protein